MPSYWDTRITRRRGLAAAGASALGAAFLNAAFDYCLGCQMYLLIQRIRLAA